MSIWNRLNTFYLSWYVYFLTWCTLTNTVIQSNLYNIEHIEVADEFITSKHPDLTRFFISKPRYPDPSLTEKCRSGWKNPAVWTLVTCGKLLLWKLEMNVWRFMFLWYNFLSEQIKHIRTGIHGHPQLSLKCRLPNRISFDVFDRCSAKFKGEHVKRYAVAPGV